MYGLRRLNLNPSLQIVLKASYGKQFKILIDIGASVVNLFLQRLERLLKLNVSNKVTLTDTHSSIKDALLML